jgi:hypothetical protein
MASFLMGSVVAEAAQAIIADFDSMLHASDDDVAD